MSEVKYYKTSDIAKRFGVTPATVRTWIREGKLIASSPSGRHRISEHELERFINQQLTKKGFNSDPS